ncbi:undecaprenyl-diphosphatase [Trinickia symbiotica]|uniref:Undecaprenyl-diphosphatase n=1 Tax=Trinickia symbiotica TaxID=863227 RepID=A0A2T3XYV4_9BURK|nr:phosphatase PAP2 family protein [Trinickia symbiotica]PTB21699.1 undecaprenyl-diphosphatase [Trinickia symbiotica]
MQAIEAFNRAVFLHVNATSGTPRWLIDAGLLVANYAIWLVPFALVCMWLAGGSQRREVAVRATLVGSLALAANQLIGMAWYHPRPFVIGLGHTFLAHAPDSSFPSDHATLLSAVALTFLYAGKRLLGMFVIAIGIAVAWARVFLGVHFPFDMIGAAGVAWMAYLVSAPLWRSWGPAVTRTFVVFYRRALARPIGQGWLRQ